MMARPVTQAFALALLSLVIPATALAQDPEPPARETTDRLTLAERAYQAVDYETALTLAEQSLDEGTADRTHLTRTYELIGIAAAALHRDEVSRNAFIRLLALNPDAQVNQRLAPALRGPFVEALGFWSSRGDGFGVEATLLSRRERLRVTMSDPLGLAATIVVGSRIDDTGAFEVQRAEVEQSPTVYIPVDGARDARTVEYYVWVLDGPGNRLVEIGNEDEPEEVSAGPPAQPAAILVPEADPRAAPEDSDGLFASPIFWVVAGVLLVGAGVTVGVLASDSSAGATATTSFGVR